MPSFVDSTDWLRTSYGITQADATIEAERVCTLRLQQIVWPEGAICPKCGEMDDCNPWEPRPPRTRGGVHRVEGRYCLTPGCQNRFTVLSSIPHLQGAHAWTATVFRAIYVLHQIPDLASRPLADLHLKIVGQKEALRLADRVRDMQRDADVAFINKGDVRVSYGELLRQVVNGNAGTAPAPRRRRSAMKTPEQVASHESEPAPSFSMPTPVLQSS